MVRGLTVLDANFWAGRLPKGCQLCREGAKMVLYLTGECQSHCFYCPVSRDRMYVDRVFANEKEVAPGDVDGVIEEARAMNAAGAGITGGDPMTKPERVIEYCTRLKQAFGPAFHTHLYTQNIFDAAWLPKLKAGGLDEIRFHPPVGWWDKMDKSPWHELVPRALENGLVAGVEVPAIPYKEDELYALASWANVVGANFVNMNELEFSEANMPQLSSRGYEFLNDSSNVVQGGSDTARHVVERCLRERMATTVHFCASTYKDSVQLRKRMIRRQAASGRSFEASTPDGTILFGIIEPEPDRIEAVYEALVAKHGVAVEAVQINRDLRRIELAPWLLESIHTDLDAPGQCFIVEVHATSTRQEVERTPLPYPEGDWDFGESN